MVWLRNLGRTVRTTQADAGRPARDVPYFDAVAALASPPGMGWFPISMAASRPGGTPPLAPGLGFQAQPLATVTA